MREEEGNILFSSLLLRCSPLPHHILGFKILKYLIIPLLYLLFRLFKNKIFYHNEKFSWFPLYARDTYLLKRKKKTP